MATKVNVKHESLLENTIESLQCYKCKAVPGLTTEQQNRYSCLDESHQLCEKCKSVCECGSVVGKRPNPTLKQILKNLPVYCPHYNNGCREIFIQAELLTNHKEECAFRHVCCPDLSCSNKVLFKDVIDHLKQNHQIKFFDDAIENKITCYFGTMFLYDGLVWFPKIIRTSNGLNFFLVGKVINQVANFWLYILSSPIQAKNYAYTLSVTGKNGNKLTYYDHVKTLDKKSCEITDKQLVFMIGIEAIKEMRNEQNLLPVEVAIYDLKEEAKDDDEESVVEGGSE